MTELERLREKMGLTQTATHAAAWTIRKVDDKYTWLLDGARAVALLAHHYETLELRCHGPASDCPPAIIPKHYHTVTQEGARIIFTWRVRGRGCGDCLSSTLDVSLNADGNPRVFARHLWADGSVSETTMELRYDVAWGAYLVEAHADLKMRRVTTALEYCNVLPAGIGDSRPGRERYTATFWSHPDGLRKMIKNPVWFCSAGAQDFEGEKNVTQGGFLGFGPDDRQNPVIEVVSSSPASGAGTCDNLQDEHMMVVPATGAQSSATGWFRLHAHYRFFSIPRSMADHIIAAATAMKPGAMLAWKFQYPPTPELPDDLRNVPLPGSPFYGPSDWSSPIPWDRPFDGRLWTASPDPRAVYHYDRGVGHTRPGSIRLRAAGAPVTAAPASGHTLHLDEGATYRLSGWIKTGGASACLQLWDLLFRVGDGRPFKSDVVPPHSDWRHVSVSLTARGDDGPFGETLLTAEGTGDAWFSDLVFERING